MSEERPIYHAYPQPQLEALLVDRNRMIRLMRIALEELHSRRRTTPSPTDEAEIVQLLRYWDEVFDWIKHQHEEDLVIMSRR